MTHSLLILTPSLDSVSLRYCRTFAALTLECARRDIRISVGPDATDPGQLVHARNVLYGAAIESNETHVLWWDADVSFPPSCLFDLLERPEAMIARPYPMRAIDWEAVGAHLQDWNARTLVSKFGRHTLPRIDELKQAGRCWTAQVDFEQGKTVWSVDGKLVRITSCGFGWVLMRVDAMRDFAETFCRTWPKDWRNRTTVNLFDLEHVECIVHGEDTSFCWRWRQSGRPIWAAVDARIQNGDHAGTFGDYLESHDLLPSERR